jgi:hypothetical protein
MADVLPVTSRAWPRGLTVLAVGLGVLFAATGALWAHYGTTVFYEMIMAGVALCF